MTREQEIAATLAEVRARIDDAVARAGRPAGCVRLVAVSKKMPAGDVLAALAAGQQDFGENYAQELRNKRAELLLANPRSHAGDAGGPRWHYLGPIQSNKVKYLAGQVALIQSLDDADILDQIDGRIATATTATPPVAATETATATTAATPTGVASKQLCLLQVNVAEESRKGGVPPHRVSALLDRFATARHVACVGLMLIPPFSDDPGATRRYFSGLREISEREQAISRPNVTLSELSMGMSADFVEAVAEGATLVRVGTAIFGARSAR